MKKKLLAMSISAALAGGWGYAHAVGAGAEAGAIGADAEIELHTSNAAGNVALDLGSNRNNTIADGYNDGAGVAHVQQNNGSSNSMNAVTAAQLNVPGDHDAATGAVAGSLSIGNQTDQLGGTRSNDIKRSFNGYAGAVTVQQNNGDNNDINAATSVASSTGSTGDVEQAAIAVGVTAGNLGTGEGIVLQYPLLSDVGSERSNTIQPGFNDASGVFTVQQNNGNANAMAAATAVTQNVGAGHVSQLVQAGGVAVANPVIDAGMSRSNVIDNAFNGAQGVATVQQNNGDANVMSAATAAAVNSGNQVSEADSTTIQEPFTLAVPLVVGSGDVRQTVEGEAVGKRLNMMDPSFGDFSGVATVQQNNGSNNVMASATAVKADVATEGEPDADLEGAGQLAVNLEAAAAELAVEIGGEGGGYDRTNALIDNSFDHADGVFTVQQNNGDNNAMGAATAVVANVDSHDDTDLVESAAGNQGAVAAAIAIDGNGHRGNSVENSFDFSSGVSTTQQNNGNNNVLQASNAVVANLDSDGDEPQAVFNQTAGEALVITNQAVTGEFSERHNGVHQSYDGASGVMTLQQNNGDNNVMGAATNVVAEQGGAGFGPSALSSAALSATVAGNVTLVAPSAGSGGFSNAITSSFEGASGVIVTQQNNGSNNAIQSAVTVVAN